MLENSVFLFWAVRIRALAKVLVNLFVSTKVRNHREVASASLDFAGKGYIRNEHVYSAARKVRLTFFAGMAINVGLK
jgi:hypothetical protein